MTHWQSDLVKWMGWGGASLVEPLTIDLKVNCDWKIKSVGKQKIASGGLDFELAAENKTGHWLRPSTYSSEFEV